MTDQPYLDSIWSSLDALEVIDAICNDFEAAWRGQREPRLEEYLGRGPDRLRSCLFIELLRAELLLILESGQRPDEEDYLQRFPEFAKQVQLQFDVYGLSDRGTDRNSLATTQAHTPRKADRMSPPFRFGDYEVLAELGEGGMGVVYQARQLTANRLVALKLIRPDRLWRHRTAERDEVLGRFRNEIRAAAKLEHDHVVTVFDVGEVEGQLYYAMRYVAGESLRDVVEEGPLEPSLAAKYVE